MGNVCDDDDSSEGSYHGHYHDHEFTYSNDGLSSHVSSSSSDELHSLEYVLDIDGYPGSSGASSSTQPPPPDSTVLPNQDSTVLTKQASTVLPHQDGTVLLTLASQAGNRIWAFYDVFLVHDIV